MDEAIKSNLVTILDKAINDADTVARIEERIRDLDDRLVRHKDRLPEHLKLIFSATSKMFKEILHGDKPADPS